MLGDLRLAPASGAPRRSRRPLIPVIMAAALVAIVAGFVIFRGHAGSTASGTTPSASSQDARRQAAVQLSALLAQSVTDRAAVIDAVADVRGCGPSLHQDARAFASAASSRQRLLSRLGSLPGRSLLPAAMLHDLTGAWQASAQVDTDLAGWTNDKIVRGCHRNSRSDADLQASSVPEGQANAGKRAFAASGTRSPDDTASPPTSRASSRRSGPLGGAGVGGRVGRQVAVGDDVDVDADHARLMDDPS